jgi:hypothetical protein
MLFGIFRVFGQGFQGKRWADIEIQSFAGV